MSKIENWTIHTRIDSNKKSFQYLTGNMFTHPKANWTRHELIDGHEIRTSPIMSLDLENNVAITQSGTVYELGIKSNM